MNDDLKKIDVRVLGQLLSAQNTLITLSSEKQIAEFYAGSLSSIPGVKLCRVCLGNSFSEKGTINCEVCSECENIRKDKIGIINFPKDFECRLAESPDYYVYPLDTTDHRFGFFIFYIEHAGQFELYKPFICNLANFVALFLENLLQKNDLLKTSTELERRVDERTLELHGANVKLQNELSERQKTEEQLAAQFTLLSALINSSSDIIIFSLDKNYCYTAFNEKHRLEMKQVWNADIQIGMNLLECMTIPELKTLAKQSMDRALNGETFSEIQHQPDSDIYYEFSWNPIFKESEIVGVTSFIRDISERKHAELQIVKLNRIYAVLSNINQAIVRIHDAKEMLNKVCKVSVEDGHFRMAWIGMVNFNTNLVDIVASFGVPEEYTKNFSLNLTDENYCEVPSRIVIETGKHKISNHIIIDENITSSRTDAIKYGYKSSASFPLIVFNKVIGVFNIYSDETDFFEEDDFKLLDEMATDISFALEFIESETERKRTEQAFEKKSEELERYFTNTLDLLCIADTNGYFHRLNPQWESTLGYTIKELEGKKFLDLVHPDDLESTLHAISTLDNQKEVLHFTNRYLCKDGSFRWIEWNSFPSGKLIYAVARDITERTLIEQERIANLYYLKNMDRINRVILGSDYLEKMMNGVLDTVLSIFNCDRAWLFYPCDPAALTFKVPMEITKPEYPGAKILNAEVPMPPDMASNLQEALESDYPITYQVGTDRPINKVSAEQFGVKSQMLIAIYPRLDKPWVFGIHQCSTARTWTIEEKKLFKEISRRLTDALTSLLSLRNLQESEERFRRLTENARDIIYRMSLPDGKYEYVSPAASTVLGYHPEEFYDDQTLFQKCLHPDWHRYFGEKWEKLIQGEMSPTYEYQIIHKSGETRWLNQRNILINDYYGKPIAIEAIVTDITERKIAEEALSKERNLLRTVINNLPDGIWTKDLNCRKTLANRANINMMGLKSEAEVLGKDDYELFPKELAEGFMRDDNSVIQTGNPVINREEYVCDEKGQKHFLLTTKLPFLDEKGRMIGLIGISRDITERKKTDDALRESEEKYRAVADFTYDWETWMDTQKKYVYVSPSCKRITGYDETEFMNDPDLFLKILYHEDVRIFEQHLEEIEESTPVFQKEFRIVRKDGEIRWIEHICQSIFDSNGKWIGRRASNRDITKRKHAEFKIRQLHENYVSLVNSVEGIVWEADANTFSFSYISSKAEKILGYPVEQWINEPTFWKDHLYDEDRTWAVEFCMNAVRKGLSHDFEYRMIAKDNRIVWMHDIVSVVVENGNAVLLRGIMVDITERKIAQLRLIESEREFRNLAENIPDHIVRYDLDGRVTYLNHIPEATNYSTSSLIGAKPSEKDFIGSKGIDVYNEKLSRVLKTGIEDSCEVEVPNLEGVVHSFEVHFVAERNNAGQIIGALARGHDITERKLNEKERQENLNFFQTMDTINRVLQETNDIERMMEIVLEIVLKIFRCDRASLIYPCDPKAAYWMVPMEKTMPEYPGALSLNMEIPVDHEAIRVFNACLTADSPVAFGPGNEELLPAIVSENFSIKSQLAVSLYPKINKPWMFVLHQCSCERIWTLNEKKLFKEIGIRLTDALTSLITLRNLRESEERYRTLVEQAMDGIFIADSNGYYIDVNKAGCQMLGYTKDQLLKLNMRDLIPKQDLYTKPIQFENLRAGKTALTERYLVCYDGSILPVEISGIMLKDNRFMGIVRDITERKKAETALKERITHSQSLLRLSKNLELAKSYPEALEAALDELKDTLGYQSIWIYLFSEDRKFLKVLSAKGVQSDLFLSLEGITSLKIDGDKMLEEFAEGKGIVVIEDARTDDRTVKPLVELLSNRTIINVPIYLFEKHIGSVGTGTFGDEGVKIPSPSEEEYLLAMASHIAVALDRIHLLLQREETEKTLIHLNRELRAISECNQALLHADDEVALLKEVCRIICDEAGYEMAWVGYIEDKDQKTIQPVAWAGNENEFVRNVVMPLSNDPEMQKNLIQKLPEECKLIYEQDITNIQLGESHQEKILKGYRSCIVAPLKDEHKKAFGFLMIYSSEVNTITQNEIRLLDELANDLAFGIMNLRMRQERKKAEESLRHVNEILRATLEAAPVAIFDLDTRGHIKSLWNKAATQMLGWERDEVIGNYLPTVTEDKKEEFKYFLDLMKAGKTIMGKDVIRQRKDGSPIEYSLYAAPEYDENNVVIGNIAVLVDITERRKAEAEFRRVMHAIEQSPVSVIMTNAAGEIEYVNPRFTDVTGYSKEEVLGKKPSILKSGRMNDLEYKQLWNTISSGKEWHGEFYNKKKNEELFWEAASISPVRDERGMITHYVAIKEDITEKKRVQKALKESEEQYRILITTVPDIIIRTDLNGNIIFVNETVLATFFNISEDKILGKDIISFISPEDRERAILNTKLMFIEPLGVKEYKLKFENVEMDCEVNGAVLRDSEGNPNGMVYVLREITARKKAEKELENYRQHLEELINERTKELEDVNSLLQEEIKKQKEAEEKVKIALEKEKELSELKSKFISLASHEFRTPLTTVLSSTELLERYGREWDMNKYVNQTERIKKSVKYLTSLMDDVLTISRAESGKIKYEPAPVNIKDLCKNILDDISMLVTPKHSINYEIKVSAAKIVLDEKLFKFIVMNLLTNAIKYSPDGGPIDFNITTKRENLIIEVRDEGIGILDHEKQHLFEPFHRGNNVGDIRGTGLGMSIIKRSVDMHLGSITFESEASKGTKFTIILPFKKVRNKSENKNLSDRRRGGHT